MSRSARPSREDAERLARALTQNDVLRAARAEQRCRFAEPARGPVAAEPKAELQPISIWRPVEVDGRWIFRRPEPQALGDHFCARLEFAAVGEPGVRRVCWLGESAAAGYLYAPHLTPAVLLQSRLGSAFEVIDLARTNETLAGLVDSLERCLQLRPDVLAIYAGNNTLLLETPEVSPYPLSVLGRLDYAEDLRRSGLHGPVERASRAASVALGDFLGRIAELARETPVVIVVPQVNLRDWHVRQPLPWPVDGSDGALDRWYEALFAGLRSLDRRDFAEAERSARRMLEIDGYLCPTSSALLSLALEGAGRSDEALDAALAEVESEQYAVSGFLAAPRASRLVQGMLRKGAAVHGFRTVDLPRLLADSGEDRPGRRFFLDYCHLTREGMEILADGVADSIFEATGFVPSAGEMAEPELSPAQEAVVYFGSAIHTAHRWAAVQDRSEILEHWCRRALEADPEIRHAMVDLIDLRTSAGPREAPLCPAASRNLVSSHALSFQHGVRYDHLDADLLEALLQALPEAERRRTLDLILRLDMAQKARDLAASDAYLWNPLEQIFADLLPPAGQSERAFLRCPWPTTTFCVVTRAEQDLSFDLTARVPSSEGQVRVEWAGRAVLLRSIGRSWSRFRATLPARGATPGLNRLTVHWPRAQPSGLGRAVDRLSLGREADVHPIFGEIFELRVGPT